MKITKSEIKILLGIGVLILLLDILLMKYWISTIKPDPFMSIGVKSYRPRIFGINIIIGIIVFFRNKRLSILFFINTIICYWIFSFFWNSWIESHPFSQSEYSFSIENRNFRLSIEKNPNIYGIYELNPNIKDSVRNIELGMNEQKGDSIILKGWDYDKWEGFNMYFYNNTLVGFPENPNEIKLIKKE